MEKVTAHYDRQGDHLWVARVEELPEVYAASRTLAGARAQIRTALGQLATDPGSSAEVVDHVELPTGSQHAVALAVEARARAAEAGEAALGLSRAAATALVADGFSLRDAATVLGVSHTRIQQLLGRR